MVEGLNRKQVEFGIVSLLTVFTRLLSIQRHSPTLFWFCAAHFHPVLDLRCGLAELDLAKQEKEIKHPRY
jgi:hypothetical protein